MRWYWLMGILLSMTSCTTVMSDRVVEESRPEIPFKQIQSNPDEVRGKLVILGGTILKVTAESGAGVLEILERPLGYRYEPIIGDQTSGRFLVKFKGELSQEVFSQNRKLTIAGRVVGNETRLVGKAPYRYPLLEMEEVYLWPRPGTERAGPRMFFGFGIGGSF